MPSITQPDRDPTHLHPLCWRRWSGLLPALEALLSCRVRLDEGYRSDARQGWLFGQGRTAAQLSARGVDPAHARPGAVVTNAWSARVSAHGWVLAGGQPAAAAVDVIPLGPDGKPWTADDPWQLFSDATDGRLDPLVAAHGLVHFRAPGKAVWDRPHLQLVEWSDARCRLML